jgi:hypothetical protein
VTKNTNREGSLVTHSIRTAPRWKRAASIDLGLGAAGLLGPGAALAAPGEYIVQFDAGTSSREARALVAAHGGRVTRDLHLIDGVGARLSAAAADELRGDPRVHAVSGNAPTATRADSVADPTALASAYNQSILATNAWKNNGGTRGAGVGVAVIDTGVAGDLPDFRRSRDDARSRVVASAVVNPAATTARDTYGHGTHVAGLIAGNGNNRPSSEPNRATTSAWPRRRTSSPSRSPTTPVRRRSST